LAKLAMARHDEHLALLEAVPGIRREVGVRADLTGDDEGDALVAPIDPVCWRSWLGRYRRNSGEDQGDGCAHGYPHPPTAHSPPHPSPLAAPRARPDRNTAPATLVWGGRQPPSDSLDSGHWTQGLPRLERTTTPRFAHLGVTPDAICRELHAMMRRLALQLRGPLLAMGFGF